MEVAGPVTLRLRPEASEGPFSGARLSDLSWMEQSPGDCEVGPLRLCLVSGNK